MELSPQRSIRLPAIFFHPTNSQNHHSSHLYCRLCSPSLHPSSSMKIFYFHPPPLISLRIYPPKFEELGSRSHQTSPRRFIVLLCRLVTSGSSSGIFIHLHSTGHEDELWKLLFRPNSKQNSTHPSTRRLFLPLTFARWLNPAQTLFDPLWCPSFLHFTLTWLIFKPSLLSLSITAICAVFHFRSHTSMREVFTFSF